MRFTKDAARQAYAGATSEGLAIARIKGGMSHIPGVESRLDCIREGLDLGLIWMRHSLTIKKPPTTCLFLLRPGWSYRLKDCVR